MRNEKEKRLPVWRVLAPGTVYALLCLASCVGVLRLYRVEWEAIFYALALCLVLGAAFMAARALQAAKRLGRIRNARGQLQAGDMPLPPARTAEEAEYQALIHGLHGQNRAQRARYEQALRDMRDDYTLWAHQIKTPIAALRLLLDDTRQEEAIELQRIETYVEVALSVQRLAGGSDLTVQEYDLDGIIKKAVRKYARLFIRKHLYLHYDTVSRRVLTDEKWLGFILEQVLLNALKYTAEGGITINLEEDALVVSDTGVGIAAEDLPRVFERGYTGYNGRVDARATGMGLYLCKKAADMLGHSLTVKSAAGAGTQVRIGLRRDPLLTD